MGHGLEVEPLGDGIGVAIHGLDLSRPMDAATFAAVRDAFLDRKVMVIPDQQGLDVADLVRFARGFGRLKPHILDQYHHPDTHEVSILTNRGDSGKGRDTAKPPGAYWHSDESYRADPADATMLYSVEIPDAGGDTLYADMARAWETLDPRLQARVEGLMAVHHIFGGRDGGDAKVPLNAAQRARVPEVSHPVVRIHPETGRKALFVNPGFTNRVEGVDAADGDALLDALFAHVTRPEFTYRHRWRLGQLVAWDNRATIHSATGGYDRTQPRTMYRMMVRA